MMSFFNVLCVNRFASALKSILSITLECCRIILTFILLAKTTPYDNKSIHTWTMSKFALSYFRRRYIFLILSSRKGVYKYLWRQKIASCQKITSCYFHGAHSADICGFAYYAEIKTMLVHSTVSELNFEHNILPVIESTG